MSASSVPASAGVLVAIRALLPSLNEQEQKVGQYVLAHPDEVVHLSMNELAHRCATGDATVFRFCKKVTAEGYQEFKIRLAHELGAARLATYVAVDPEDSHMEAARKIIAADIKALQDTLVVLDSERLQQVLDALRNARRIHIYGSGGAAVAATELAYRLTRVGIQAVAHTDAKMQFISANLLSAQDVALGISHSGQSPELLRAMEVARQTGATLIAITNHPASALSRMAHLTLLTAAQEELGHTYPFSTRASQIALIDILYGCLVQGRGNNTERTSERIARTANHESSS